MKVLDPHPLEVNLRTLRADCVRSRLDYDKSGHQMEELDQDMRAVDGKDGPGIAAYELDRSSSTCVHNTCASDAECHEHWERGHMCTQKCSGIRSGSESKTGEEQNIRCI